MRNRKPQNKIQTIRFRGRRENDKWDLFLGNPQNKKGNGNVDWKRGSLVTVSREVSQHATEKTGLEKQLRGEMRDDGFA